MYMNNHYIAYYDSNYNKYTYLEAVNNSLTFVMYHEMLNSDC